MSFIKTLVASCIFALSVSVSAAPQAAPAAKAKPAAAAKAKPAAAPKPAPGPIVLELSHQLDEIQAERVEPFIENFNKQSKDMQVKLVRRAEGDAPKQLNLVTSEEYARFLAKKASFKPLHQVMREAKLPLDSAKFSPELRGNQVYIKGQLFALPLAFATPVLFINKQAFIAAGLDPESPPKTWETMQEAAGKLIAAGSQCPYTTSWPAWILIDNISAWNGDSVHDARGRLAFNGLLQIKHVAMMATWHKAKYFAYFGRRNEADQRFANGECGMLTSNSSLFAILPESFKQNVGVSPLPYHDDVRGAPQNTLAEGASLWVKSGLKPAETRAVAKFVNYVLGPEVQIELTLAGGFLPMTGVARAAAGSKLMKTDLNGLQVAYEQLKGKSAAPSVRVSQIEPVRLIVEEELESLWAGRKPAKEALDNAVQRGNAVIQAKLKK
ncbi:sn-glycerol-3-phosphate ABC transporter substrate-binding protein [Betaproteobacteria bacterium]|nr:sn-glycerol-3-phosphate ABC transporter substrate-binding protein [Betaproteobacteria bacterium]